jgi:sodium/potassium-transporting ATPase subunit alpha
MIDLCLVFFFNYIPFWNRVIGTSQVPFEYYLFPIAFGLGMLMLEELVISSVLQVFPC